MNGFDFRIKGKLSNVVFLALIAAAVQILRLLLA